MNGRRRLAAWVLAALLALPGAANAGPPFLTDDPEPTETSHWEIYAPAFDAAGRGRNYEGAAGVEINYGAAPNVQVTVGLPMAIAHDADGFKTGRGDLELSIKFRFFDDEETGVSIAAFPGLTLPTARRGFGAEHVTGFLPVWAQRDAGPWSVFGGSGYAVNPGAGNRNFWTGGLAVSRQVCERVLLGVEIDRDGANTDGGEAATSLGVGGILQLKKPFRLLGSAGPTWVDGEGSPGFHAFVALGLDF